MKPPNIFPSDVLRAGEIDDEIDKFERRWVARAEAATMMCLVGDS